MDAGFFHELTEIWYNGTQYKICLAPPLGEDPACSDSVSILDLSVEDHLHYMNEYEDCDGELIDAVRQ